MEDSAAAFIKADIERVCAEFTGLAPAVRLRRIAELRAALDEATAHAQAMAMADARAEGWGLRRIGEFCGISHEKVRRILAAHPAPRGEGALPAGPGRAQRPQPALADLGVAEQRNEIPR
ncbi:hypothetical protein ACFPZ0_00640 [Streptomonospora nanhaiensis]|uniref:hypothetical protein n=1 Tax=Streptomonospora nanhaiensis TaxID=1323731 RepID=UPI001C99F848|nr:hypothetical protein [Streptomonospora nanhaiensis]MBX9386934.1 hypothetical protein [Streptomonospora nanhaiensis]